MARPCNHDRGHAVFTTHRAVHNQEYLIVNEGADVNCNMYPDDSLFQSRYPAELGESPRGRGRTVSMLSTAVKAGHVNLAEKILDAGAKHDHAIEFAAMCGLQYLVRLLWGRGENSNDAVQGAFIRAVERENIAMFHLLEELGAKIDDDVRVLAIKAAQEEGCESMVEFLSEEQGVLA